VSLQSRSVIYCVDVFFRPNIPHPLRLFVRVPESAAFERVQITLWYVGNRTWNDLVLSCLTALHVRLFMY
jgi:hypothetical protein